MRRRIVLSAEVPDNATDEEIADYVADAIVNWGGSLRPPGAYGEQDDGDPMFGGASVRSITMRGTRYQYK